MAQGYTYQREGMEVSYDAASYDFAEMHNDGTPAEMPPLVRDLFPVKEQDSLEFEPGVTDLRLYLVNTPNGDTIGTICGYLADGTHYTLPYLYVKTSEGKVVIVPTDQVFMFIDQCLVTLEGGKTALDGAPQAEFTQNDAVRAERYWGDFRRRNAA
ncbi:MAG: hypothetical protein ACYDBB_00845 [Armatimonadota bacterium]